MKHPHHWTTQTDDDGITWVRLDKVGASANVLSTDVMTELGELLENLQSAPPRGVVIFSGKQGAFVMGADINEFTSIDGPERAYEVTRQGQRLFSDLESLECPTVAVLDGFALGGGLELAMACDYRIGVADDKPVLGLPEVQLGLHPGFGGTVRAVHLCGVRPAMRLMLTGNPITVDTGRKIGLIDRIVSHDNWRQAAKEMIASRQPKNTAPFMERLLNLWPVRPFVKMALTRQVAARARREHYPAPYAIVDLWAKAGASVHNGYEAEARSFARLMCTPTSRNLVRVFFLRNRLKAQGNKVDKSIAHVHVVGAGVMGGDIAAWCALQGLTVTLQDREEKYVRPAIERAGKLFGKRVRRDDERAATAARLRSDVAGDGIAQADLIIEAIFENLEAKQELYGQLAAQMKPGALLATNTSSIRLEELRSVLPNPRRFIGLHFFNPVAALPLVEVIRCGDTEQAALDLGFAFVKGIGKLPLECLSAPGFVVNRILAPYMNEAMQLVEAGVPLVAIDRAAERFGMPMGPVELVDSVGIDVALHVSKVLSAATGRPLPPRLESMVDDGRLGRKSGQGFYQWVEGKAVKPDAGGAQAPADIEDRLILPMVNEAVACLADGIVADEELLDAGVIFGTGFAPFRGGPIRYARDRGVDTVVAALERLAAAYGERFAPHPGWSKM
jgi:3-hydroxyacyl-CoA dehydrogenase / enoyl-CoA hydratase / 3-hydroxybutyryl-CoA epimerase